MLILIDSVNVVTVVLVNWNGWQDTVGCLESIQASSDFPGKINVVIVDNSSSDQSLVNLKSYLASSINSLSLDGSVIERLARIGAAFLYEGGMGAISSLLLVEAKDNYGFAAGNNIGWQFADFFWASNYYWVLNNDTRIVSDTANSLIRKATSHEDISICGCSILYLEDPQRVQSYGGSWYSLKTGRGWSVGMGQLYDTRVKSSVIETQINYISGASMLIKAQFLHRVGGLCEDYFLYNEEIDLSMKLSRRERLAVATEAKVYHKVGSSIGSDKGHQTGSQLSAFFQTRSKLIFAKKHTPLYLPSVWLVLLARSIKFILYPQSRSNGLTILSVLFGNRKANPSWFKNQIAGDLYKSKTS